MARRNDHSRDELREMALSAAERVLQQEGFKALSARRVAADIGYSAGSLYTLFKNLDDLCWQLNARTLTQLLAELDRVEQTDAKSCLLAYGHAYMAFAHDHPARWALLFEHGGSRDMPTPASLSERIDSLFARVEVCLQQLKPEMPAAECALTARTLWSGVHGIAVLALRQKLFLDQAQSADKMLQQLVDHFIKGWLIEECRDA
ncbi:MAG: TetR/AcrR family transcriptional regulator [Oceanospirillales bacterium]|uniref:TetR family transcriptional regulator n=1 Tax=Marinobacterium halophilum TaxID=267374 RepID=A0A2P8F0I6_9GAMM|nr:WHG domain-containing protein [Marinobacterium halophilum]MBR9829718.1 TetR/AcrR family transcriptional regulator [Oceanospirillales bacterium]PSL15188.1 TetR family transcriptional regulator [Marinobacterium halophilum]